MIRNSWDGILETGERILWQGQPAARLSPKPGQIAESFFGLFFVGFSLIWMRTAMSMTHGPIWMFGLIFFFIGLYQVFGKYLWQRYERGHTWYSLSDRAAYIATETPIGGRRLRVFPFEGVGAIDYLPGPLASIYFGRESYRVNGRARSVPVGFENLPDGDHVFDLISKIRKGEV